MKEQRERCGTPREFLSNSALASGAAVVGLSARSSVRPGVARGIEDENASGRKLVDTHLHCFAGLEDDRFPYHIPPRPTSRRSGDDW
jgi:hypothetical protein